MGVTMKRLFRWNPSEFDFPAECARCSEPMPGMEGEVPVCDFCQREAAHLHTGEVQNVPREEPASRESDT